MHSLYSAIYINADEEQGPNDRWSMFDQGRGQVMPGQRNAVIMTPTHTNIPRSGDSGLPHDWKMRVDTWRAQTSLRFVVDPVLEWASETNVELRYNARTVERSPLVDLLLAAQPCFEPTDWDGSNNRMPLASHPLIFDENIGFQVNIQSTPDAMRYLRRWMVANVETARMTLWIHLQGACNHGVM